MPYLQILQKYAYQGIFHAEFISAMKTVQNPTIFVKNAKKKEIDQFVISVHFLRFSLKLLSRISEKVRKYVFRWKEDK